MYKFKTNIVNSILLIAILTTSLYAFTNILPVGLRSFRYLWGPLALFSIFLSRPKVFSKLPIVYLLLYGFISLIILQFTLWTYMTDWNQKLLKDEFYAIIVFLSIFLYYQEKKDFLGLATLGKISFYFIVITILMTNLALTLDPLVVRQSADSEHFSLYQQKIFNWTGAANYGYMQAIVCLIPIIIYHIKFRKNFIFSRKYVIAFLILLYITIIRAQIFANIIIAIAITFISLFAVRKSITSFIIIILIVLIVLLIPTSVYSNLTLTLSTLFTKYSNVSFKLNDFAQFIQNPEIGTATAAGGRIERYPLLFKALLSKPFLGNSSYNSPFDIQPGGHLYWMNKLSQWGIFGFIFYLHVLYTIYSSIRKRLNDSYGFYYFLSALTFIIFGLMKNIAGREPFFILIIVIPSLYYLPLINIQKSK